MAFDSEATRLRNDLPNPWTDLRAGPNEPIPSPRLSAFPDESLRRRPRFHARPLPNQPLPKHDSSAFQPVPSPAFPSDISSSTCSACGLAMQGPFVRALGTVFHLSCFKCLDCGDVVASKFFPIDGPDGKQQPLCERDYFRRRNLICAKCGLALRGSYITACDKKYHVEHFTCTLCPTLFGPQDSYYEHDRDVYCPFHYSTRFATKCAGCSSAILKEFVEINRNMRDECWHPECYMINKFWNVKVVSRRSSGSISDGSELEPSYVEEEKRETPISLSVKQVRMEQLVYRIWTILSAFEESSAACISDMLRQVNIGQYLDTIRMAEKFILHVEVLFGTIDDLEYHCARLSLKGMSHVREARMLCRKTVDLFTLLSHTQETGSRRIGMTQELLALVTGLAHYLKILIRIALTGALRLEREQSVREAMPSFLDKLHLLAVQGGDPAARRIIKNGSGEAVGQTSGADLGTQGVTYGFRSLAPELAGDSPFSATSPSKLSINNPPSDLCVRCTQTVEEACVRLGTYQRWHSGCLQCNKCGKAAEDKDKEQDKTDKDPSKKPATRRPPANVSIFVYDVESIKETPSFGDVPSLILCTDHAYVNCRGGFQAVSGLEQYAFLLNVALRRLYLLLKRRGVIPLSPSSSIAPNPKGGDQDPYRNSGDIMGMKSMHLDRKLSATARLPRRSTIVESPAGRTVHPSEPVNAQRLQQEIKLPQPQRGRTPELGEVPNLRGEHHDRALDLEQRSSKQPERLGDIAVDAKRYDEAISYYTTALSFNPPSSQDILIKRSKAFLATGSWKQALDDANQAIMLDPSSPCGYEVKHAALHKAGDYDNAVDAFEVMLSRIMESPDPKVQRLGDQYISPSSTRATIRKIVQRTIRHLPRVLINTTTGRLHDRAEQASTFEALPIFNELVSSVKTRVDYVRIKREVRQYFRYVMLSHKWEDNEPLFQQVVHIAAYDLDTSPTHDKLQMFCKIVRDAGFNWAWSDTCCINKSDHFVLQEALVAMFKWYQDSAMMFVFLRGVRSPSQRGALVKSIWNTRAWTLQEYVASKVIRFYTEDWTLYLDLELPNHKESPEVISEMEDATGVSAQLLMTLRPGLTCIREKLRLASTRQTTLVEDAAYSLLGIFSVTGIPAIYGEGEGSLGRLLAHILAGSGDVSILAWTGESGCFNSCLPAHITVFDGPATSHLPSPIPDAEMERILTVSHLSSFDLDIALRLYDRLDELPAPWFAASRMKLPCIAFQLPPLSPYRTRSGRVYRVDTVVFGMVEIKTRQDLSRMKSLYLVHPWLETILDRDEEQSGAFIEDDEAPPPSPSTDDEEGCDEKIDDDFSSLLERESLLLPALERMAPMDREMRARRLVARLRQPFGALLVTLAAAGRRAVDYRRVAADCLITVQIQDNFPLSDLLDNVRTFDVL